MADHNKQVVIENARLIFLNFEGKEGPYNRAGDRNFSVVLPQEVATQMAQDGWNVKYLKPRDEDEVATAYLPVTASYKTKPPMIVVMNSLGRMVLTEDVVGELDFAEIETVDLIVNPYAWNVQGKSGISAYLKSMYVTLAEDVLSRKYAVGGAGTDAPLELNA